MVIVVNDKFEKYKKLIIDHMFKHGLDYRSKSIQLIRNCKTWEDVWDSLRQFTEVIGNKQQLTQDEKADMHTEFVTYYNEKCGVVIEEEMCKELEDEQRPPEPLDDNVIPLHLLT